MASPQPPSGPSPQVLQWLHRVIAPEYQDPQRTYHDVATALAALPSLAPRTSVYTHETGKSELLVHLFGTLPVIFRGATYNIPFALYVPQQYPRQPPIAFVTPAKDMMVRPGNHVDLAGRCYHPYLANWVHSFDRSNIADLCEVLRGVFGREPPVMAKVQAPVPKEVAEPPPRPPLPPELVPKSSPPVELRGPPPLPPLPREFTGHVQGQGQGERGAQAAGGDPRRHPMQQPPYSHQQLQQQPQQNSMQNPQQHPQHPQNQPPQPQHQAPNQNQQQQSLSSPRPPQYGPGTDPGSPVHYRPGPSPGPPVQYRPAPSPGSPVQYRPGPGPASPVQHAPTGVPAKSQAAPPYQQLSSPQQRQAQLTHRPPPPIPPHPGSHQQPQYQPQRPISYQSYPPAPAPAPPKPTPIDLLDSPSIETPTHTAAPPPPPNPEKDLLITRIVTHLSDQAAKTHAQTTAALSGAAAQRAALHAATASLEREQHELRHIASVCDQDAEILRERIAQAEGVVQDCRNRELPDVDSMVVAASVVETQLYDLVAEDQAIEDTIYVLGKALDRERIGFEVFLKERKGHARTLAREQFLKRALVRKIEEEMGLV